MKKIVFVMALIITILFLAFPFVAFSQTSGQAGIQSNYLWRGTTFSNNQPVVQVEAESEVTHGFYLGTFASNAAFNDPSRDTMTQEVDAIVGKKFTGKDFELNLSHTHLFFPGAGVYDADETAAQLKVKQTIFRASQMHDFFGYNSIYRYYRVGQEFTCKKDLSSGIYLGYNSFNKQKNVGNTDYLDLSVVTKKTLEDGSAISLTLNGTNRKLYTDNGKESAKDFMAVIGYTIPFNL
jgi:uncharacterized protein (TIGR02001 family)